MSWPLPPPRRHVTRFHIRGFLEGGRGLRSEGQPREFTHMSRYHVGFEDPRRPSTAYWVGLIGGFDVLVCGDRTENGHETVLESVCRVNLG